MADQSHRANTIGRFAFLGSIACAVAIGACSSSSSPVTSGTDASTDASTADQASSEASTDEADADAATSTAGPVTCGSLTCTAPASGLVPLSACCLPDNTCGASPNLSSLGGGAAPPAGVDAGSVCLTLETGTPDPSCPSQTVMGFALAGCCAAGTCGYDLSIIGLGCNSFSAFGGGLGAKVACSTGGDGAAPPADAEADAADAQTSATTDAQTDSGTPTDAQADATDGQSSPTDAQADGESATDARADAADAH
jgi:hypothetical protein